MKLLKKIFKKDINNITFIFGAPRSGTTWLWSLLESHPNILPFVDNAELRDGVYSTSESGIYIKKRKEAKQILSVFCNTHKNDVVIEKTPSHTLCQETILKDFPKSKNVIILRHPLAIANSMIHSNMDAFNDYDVHKSILEIKKYYRELENLCKKESFFVLTYEELSIHTFDVLKKIYLYLGLSVDGIDEMIFQNVGKTKVGVKGAFRKGKLHSYENELTAEQKDILISNLGSEIMFYKKNITKY